MMTESEAKTRWCPMVRFKSAETGSGPAFNRQRIGSDMDDVNCIGSKCMAWRQQTTEGEIGGEPALFVGGYCGLAGKE
jgi:hypothetical protein